VIKTSEKLIELGEFYEKCCDAVQRGNKKEAGPLVSELGSRAFPELYRIAINSEALCEIYSDILRKYVATNIVNQELEERITAEFGPEESLKSNARNKK